MLSIESECLDRLVPLGDAHLRRSMHELVSTIGSGGTSGARGRSWSEPDRVSAHSRDGTAQDQPGRVEPKAEKGDCGAQAKKRRRPVDDGSMSELGRDNAHQRQRRDIHTVQEGTRRR